jgi:hypothetical protein
VHASYQGRSLLKGVDFLVLFNSKVEPQSSQHKRESTSKQVAFLTKVVQANYSSSEHAG